MNGAVMTGAVMTGAGMGAVVMTRADGVSSGARKL